MRTVVTGKDIRIGDDTKAKIEKKLAKFDRYFDDNAVATVKIQQEPGNKVSAEITMKIEKHYYRAEAVAQEVISAFESAVSIMEGQIRKHKARMHKQIRDFAYMNEYLKDVAATDEGSPAEGDIIRRKRFSLSVMTEEEATLQMELLGHSFLLYISADTGTVCAVYKRKDGNYGLLEPEY